MHRPIQQFALAILAATTLFLAASAHAQERHFPLDHRQPPGTAGRWNVLTQPQLQGYVQPVQIILPTEGHVTYYAGSPQNAVLTQSPSRSGMMVGHPYRVRISGMPEFPGIELYPTIEVLNRLHPPEGRANDFPIPIELTAEEIEIVLEDRMVTKVIYLEEPDLAVPFSHTDRELIEDLPGSVNLLQAADQRGRPMAILRIGGRIPDPLGPTDEFFSRSPIVLPPQ